jgi:two-component system, NarL family, sensor histidine kinase YdfH
MKNSYATINTEKDSQSFFWFLTLILTGMTVWMIVSQPEIRRPLLLIPFVVLMAVHIVLHWRLRRFSTKPNWTIVYIMVQSLIALALIWITRNIGVTLGLTMALVGETIGLYGVSPRGLLASLYYLVCSIGFYIWRSGVSQIGWWLIAIIPMLVFVVIYVELYSRQVKANNRAQELLKELESANRQLTEYAAQVEDLTIAAERQRMARELHDTLSQGLAGLILQLEAVDANLAADKIEKSRKILQQTMESARSTLANARLAIDDLRQPQSSDCEKSLQEIAARFSKETSIPCELDVHVLQALEKPVTEAITRITSEALANIILHAKAAHVSIKAVVESRDLVFDIHDDGIGFNPASIPATGHYGLIGMDERARLIGGHISIKSEPGQGTTISLRIPLP